MVGVVRGVCGRVDPDTLVIAVLIEPLGIDMPCDDVVVLQPPCLIEQSTERRSLHWLCMRRHACGCRAAREDQRRYDMTASRRNTEFRRNNDMASAVHKWAN